jgi:Bax protein
MRGISLSLCIRSFAAARTAIVKPAHISGLGLGLCLILALANPPSGAPKANARIALPAATGHVEADRGDRHDAQRGDQRGKTWSKFGPTGNLGVLDMAKIVQGLDDSKRLVGYFEQMGYRLDSLRDGVGTVPRLYLASLPNDLPQVESPEVRKAVFIKAVLPIILRVNEEVLARRAKLQALARKTNLGRELSTSEQAWLAEMADLYGAKSPDVTDLLRRIDVVPPSLTLAQAALESGWGTSRFAQKGNALFGQKIFVDSPDAMPSYDRNGNEVFRMRSFDDVLGSVRSYMHNLNSHPAYADFRKLRAEMRRKVAADRNDFGPTGGDALAKTLVSYSERGADYIADVRHLMQINDLRVFDRARLASEQTASLRPGV